MCDYSLHAVASQPARAGGALEFADAELVHRTSLREGQEAIVQRLPVGEAEPRTRALPARQANA
ncbi:MAG TPA: hypothetical protein VMU69_26105 [Bradyrhizobium sp.]|nr:hypothetical protein [Bradyrhizobium sp.]